MRKNQNQRKKTGIQLFKADSAIFKDDDNAEDKYEKDEEETKQEEEKKVEEYDEMRQELILQDIENELKGMRVDEALFQEENIDELNEIDENNEENQENGEGNVEEEEKHNN